MTHSRRKLSLYPLLLFFCLASLLAGASCASKERISKHRPGQLASRAPSRPGMLKSVRPYTIMGVTYYPLNDAYGYRKTGIASWYGKKFHGKATASGEIYNMRAVTAAHKTLPLQTMVEVTRLDTGKKIVVRINDRGPFVANRIIDLSYAAAQKLGMANRGTARVRVVALAKGRPGKRNAPPVIAEPAPDFSHGRFWVQVGAFGLSENAERLRDRLLFPGDRIRLRPTPGNDGKTLIRVQIGPYAEMGLADRALATVIEQGFETSFIVAD
ncbi:Septum-associated rare lipoprotein A [hydrothermal vent metagenome]|uniref:Septum-associated rare lipoprotein A n=1 Tax=hydrothermal vent metagenome TaxID=652676 RepID=A0A3B1CRV7_9ZZZZ